MTTKTAEKQGLTCAEKNVDICVTKANLLEFREYLIRRYGYKKLTMEDIIKMAEKVVGKKIKLVE